MLCASAPSTVTGSNTNTTRMLVKSEAATLRFIGSSLTLGLNKRGLMAAQSLYYAHNISHIRPVQVVEEGPMASRQGISFRLKRPGSHFSKNIEPGPFNCVARLIAFNWEFSLVIEVDDVDGAFEAVVGVGQLADDFVDAVADLLGALGRDHVREAAALRHLDQCIRRPGVLVGDVFDEQQDENVVLVLAGVEC